MHESFYVIVFVLILYLGVVGFVLWQEVIEIRQNLRPLRLQCRTDDE